MNGTNRLISYLGQKPSAEVQRTVRKQIEKWIERRKIKHSIDNQSRYEIRFEQTPEVKGCFCHYRIQIGCCTWEGYDFGPSIEKSLHLALRDSTISFVRSENRTYYLTRVEPNGGHSP